MCLCVMLNDKVAMTVTQWHLFAKLSSKNELSPLLLVLFLLLLLT